MGLFSMVTLAFHGFFVAWLARSLAGTGDAAGITISSLVGLVLLLLPVLMAGGFGNRVDAGWWRRM